MPTGISGQMSQWGQQIQGQNQIGNLSGSYLDSETLQKLAKSGDWFNYYQELGRRNLFNLTDMNSPMYQQYASYLQKTTPGIGANTLLAPLMAGGASYGGSQAITGQRATAMAGQRQDKINTGVQGFAGAMQGQAGGMIGQLQSNLMNQQQMAEQRRQGNATPWGQIGGAVGAIAGSFIPIPGVGTAIGTAIGAGLGGMAGGGMSPMQGGEYAYQGTPSMGSPGGWY